MKRNIVSIVIALLTSLSAVGQVAGSDVKSPVVGSDGRVTFNVYAPQARQVEVVGDFLGNDAVEKGNQGTSAGLSKAALTPRGDGLWSYTSPQLASDLYSYFFLIDGTRCLDERNVYVNRYINSLMNIFIVRGDSLSPGALYSVNRVAHGTVSKVWYTSPTLGMERRMTVYLPAGYERGGRYPVLYLLHGAGQDEDAWTTDGRAAQILDNLIAQGRCRRMIVVMPNGNANREAAPGEGSEGMYRPDIYGGDGPQTKARASFPESIMDVVRFVDSRYRTLPDRAHRAVCGLSMGGGHTFMISRMFPGQFSYYGLFSPGLSAGKGIDLKKPFAEQMKGNAAFDAEMSRLFGSQPRLFWLGIGKADFLYQMNADFRHYLDRHGYPYEYEETSGGHVWGNWRRYLIRFVQELF